MIIAVASRKASPGVTTLTGLLATYWREADVARFIVEADPSGGTLAARWSEAHNLSWNPGLIELSTSRVEHNSLSLATITQLVAQNVFVAAAPPSPGQVINALTVMGDPGAAALAAAPGIRCFVDCGRLTSQSPALPLARRAAVTLLVCRPDLEEIHGLLAGVVELSSLNCKLGLVLVGDGQWSPQEIAARAEIDLLGHIPFEERAARLFKTKGLLAGRGFQRSGLARSVEELASSLQMFCAETLRPTTTAPPARNDNLVSPAIQAARRLRPPGLGEAGEQGGPTPLANANGASE